MGERSTSGAETVVGPIEPYRYSVTCWDDDCPDPLDTYGKTDGVLEIAREHVAKHGHPLRVQVSAIIDVTPGGEG